MKNNKKCNQNGPGTTQKEPRITQDRQDLTTSFQFHVPITPRRSQQCINCYVHHNTTTDHQESILVFHHIRFLITQKLMVTKPLSALSCQYPQTDGHLHSVIWTFKHNNEWLIIHRSLRAYQLGTHRMWTPEKLAPRSYRCTWCETFADTVRYSATRYHLLLCRPRRYLPAWQWPATRRTTASESPDDDRQWVSVADGRDELALTQLLAAHTHISHPHFTTAMHLTYLHENNVGCPWLTDSYPRLSVELLWF